MNKKRYRKMVREEAKRVLTENSFQLDTVKRSRPQKQAGNNPVLAEKVAAIRAKHDEAKASRKEKAVLLKVTKMSSTAKLFQDSIARSIAVLKGEAQNGTQEESQVRDTESESSKANESLNSTQDTPGSENQ